MSDNFFQKALRHSPDLVCQLGLDFRLISVNREWEKEIGITAIHKPGFFNDFIYSADVDKLPKSDDVSSSSAIQFEVRMMLLTGQVRWFSWKILQSDEDDTMWAFGRDIHRQMIELEELNDKRWRYTLATRAARDGVWDWNIIENTVYFSSTWKAQLGYLPDELPNEFETWQKLLHPDDYSLAHERLYSYLESSEPFFELTFRLRHKDGSYRWIHNRAASLLDSHDKPYRMLGVHRDITSEVLLRNELKEAMQKAEVANIYKNNFLANMSHEIRTPMNGIIGFSELLKEPDLETDERDRYIRIINDNCNVLLNLVDDIIDISKIEANELKLQPTVFSMRHLMLEIKEFYDSYKVGQHKGHIQIHVRIPDEAHNDVIEADQIRLRQVISNLINNGLKFIHLGHIEIGYEVINNDWIQIFVKDTGIGIPKEKIEVVFERFRQSDESITRKYGGTGLGLSISKGLVQLLGGNIWVESELGVGTIFYFRIPYSKMNINPSSIMIQDEIVVDAVNFQDRKLLVVEDIAYNYEYLSEVLKKTGIQIEWAREAEQALSMLNNGRFDLILLDLKLPGRSGFEIAPEIRLQWPDLPVVAQSAYADNREISLFKSYGYDDYLVKPILKKELFSVLGKYL